MAEEKPIDLRRARALEALMTSKSVKEASGKCEIPQRSLWRLIKNPTFQAELREAQRAVWGEIGRQLLATGQGAVTALEEIAVDQSTKPSARVSAASKLLDLIFRVIVDTDILERLDRLEAASGSSGAEEP